MNTEEGDDWDEGDYGIPCPSREEIIAALTEKIETHKDMAVRALTFAERERHISYAVGYASELQNFLSR